VAKAGQIDGIVGEFHAHQAAIFGQAHVVQGGKAVKWHMRQRAGGIGQAAHAALIGGVDGEYETAAERMGGAKNRAGVHRLADAFHADAEISSHGESLNDILGRSK